MKTRLRFWTALALLAAASAFAPTEVDTYLRKARGSTVAERVESVSLAFYGVPYIDAPLGEGPKGSYDQGPLFRFDGFDCTTYVETVLALATTKKADEFETRLKRIRYKRGTVGFTERNHFPCVDWIPNNIRSGLLTDITEEIGTRWGIQYASATVNKRGWYEKLPLAAIRIAGISEPEREKKLAELHAEGIKFRAENPIVPYIPLEKIIRRKEVPSAELARRKVEEDELALRLRTEAGKAARRPQAEEDSLEKKIHDEIVDKRLRYLLQDAEVDPVFLAAIPSATILDVVRPGWAISGTQMNISHQGFVIQKKEGTYFRHVSRTGGRAKDVPLANYLRLCLQLPAIKGVHLLRVNDVR